MPVKPDSREDLSSAAPQPTAEERAPSIERAAGLGALTSIIGVIGAVIRSKSAAYFIGPAGLGAVAEVQQVAVLGLAPLSTLTGPALAQANARLSAGDRTAVGASGALAWTSLGGALLSFFVVAIAPLVLPSNLGVPVRPMVALAAAAVTLTSIFTIAVQTLVFKGRLGTSSQLQLTTVLVGSVLAVFATWAFGTVGQLIAVAATPLLVLPLAFARAKDTGLWPARVSDLRPDLDFLRSALILGGASFGSAMALQLALYAIRWRLELAGGAALNGQFQASWAIGSLYLGTVLTGVSNFAFPRYAQALSATKLQADVDETARFVAGVAPPVVAVALCFADLGIHLAYSDQFQPAVGALRWQLAGDVAKCFAWAYAGPLLYRSRVRAYLVCELSAAAMLGSLSWILIPTFGVEGVGKAYVITYGAYLLIVAAALRSSLEVSARPRHLLLVAAVTGLLSIGAWLPLPLALRLIVTAVCGIWLWKSGIAQRLLRRDAV